MTFPVQDIAPNRTVGVAGLDIIPSLQANSYSFGWWLGFEVFQVRSGTLFSCFGAGADVCEHTGKKNGGGCAADVLRLDHQC